MKDKFLTIAFNGAVVSGVVAIYNGQTMFIVGGVLLLVTVGIICAGVAARD